MFITQAANIHPKVNSPLINQGYYETGVTPTTDADGETRNNPPTILAYEFNG